MCCPTSNQCNTTASRLSITTHNTTPCLLVKHSSTSPAPPDTQSTLSNIKYHAQPHYQATIIGVRPFLCVLYCVEMCVLVKRMEMTLTLSQSQTINASVSVIAVWLSRLVSLSQPLPLSTSGWCESVWYSSFNVVELPLHQ